jgi:hypothetical protein
MDGTLPSYSIFNQKVDCWPQVMQHGGKKRKWGLKVKSVYGWEEDPRVSVARPCGESGRKNSKKGNIFLRGWHRINDAAVGGFYPLLTQLSTVPLARPQARAKFWAFFDYVICSHIYFQWRHLERSSAETSQWELRWTQGFHNGKKP